MVQKGLNPGDYVHCVTRVLNSMLKRLEEDARVHTGPRAARAVRGFIQDVESFAQVGQSNCSAKEELNFSIKVR